jgi:hypothetical protein
MFMVLCCGWGAGCVTSRRQADVADYPKHCLGWRENEAAYYWGTGTYLCNNYPPTGTAEFWSENANDKSRTREGRCMAAALCFGAYVKPGFDTDKIRTAIPDSRWLEEAGIEQVILVGGRWPYTIEGFHFYLVLFPDAKAFRNWRIDFTLSAPNEGRILSLDDARRFLRGTLRDNTVQIQEFIMMFPLPNSKFGFVEELHTRRGIGIKVVPEGWYEF